jgi:hypothetical protein
MAFDKLDSISFERFLRQQDPFGRADACLDLSKITFVSAAAMVQLAAACYSLAEGSCRPSIVVIDESVRGYLLRAGFVKCVAPVTEFVPDFPPAAVELSSYYFGSNRMLIEVTQIRAGGDLPNLLDRVLHVLRHRLKYPKYDAFDITTAVSEISQNTFDHNGGSCGFLAMQVYGTAPSRFLEIGVSDSGAGLRSTLLRNPRHANVGTDLEAIRLAIQPGVSEHDDPTRGTGLYHLLQNAYDRGGTVQICSGTAKVRFRGDRKQGWAFSVPPMPGVHIAVTLPAQSPT